MPYDKLSDLPENVKSNLPKHAQEIYKSAFNNAYHEYKHSSDRRSNDNREATAHKVAWAAVEKKYKKDSNNNWTEK